jgi:hypothetical protein
LSAVGVIIMLYGYDIGYIEFIKRDMIKKHRGHTLPLPITMGLVGYNGIY